MYLDEPLLFPGGKLEERFIFFEGEVQEKQQELLEKAWGEQQDEKTLEYNLWYQESYCEILELFEKAVQKLDQQKIYYFGCPIRIYSETFEERKNIFLKEFEDAKDIDFIEEELKAGIFKLPYDQYIFTKIEKKFQFSLSRRLEFLESKANELSFTIEYHKPRSNSEGETKETFEITPLPQKKSTNIESLQWQGGQTELMELAKALIQAGKIKGTQKEVVQSFSEFFQKEIKHPDKLLQDIKNRSNGSETLLLDNLKKNLLEYLQQ